VDADDRGYAAKVANANDRGRHRGTDGVLGAGDSFEACRASSCAIGAVHRRSAMHRMSRTREHAFQRNAACEDLSTESEERPPAAGVRSLSRSGFRARQERTRQDQADRVHTALGNACGRAEWSVLELPRGWQQAALAGIGAREE